MLKRQPRIYGKRSIRRRSTKIQTQTGPIQKTSFVKAAFKLLTGNEFYKGYQCLKVLSVLKSYLEKNFHTLFSPFQLNCTQTDRLAFSKSHAISVM